MADLTKMAASEVAEEHATEAHAPYLKVWLVLAVLTLVEYFYAAIFKELVPGPAPGLACSGP